MCVIGCDRMGGILLVCVNFCWGGWRRWLACVVWIGREVGGERGREVGCRWIS
jgi:hypothetical protein